METYQPVDSYQTRKPYKKKGKLLSWIVLFFLLIAMILFFNSPLSKVYDIQVNGLKLLSEKDILNQAAVNPSMQYLFTSSKSIKNSLLELNEIKTVDVKKQFPGKLIINIQEYEPVAYLLDNKTKKWLPVLENGHVLIGENNDFYLNRPLITKWFNQDKIPALAAQLIQINASVLVDISEIRENPNEEYKDKLLLITREGYKVHVSLHDLAEKLSYYSSILDNLKKKSNRLGDIYLLEAFRFESFSND